MLVEKLYFRAMIALDAPAIATIAASAGSPLTPDRVRRWNRWGSRPRIGLVAECRDEGDAEYQVIAFAFYTVRRGRVTLDRLAVGTGFRRCGVGRRLLAEVRRRMATHCVARLEAAVRETDLAAQLFARACGVRATALVPGHYNDTGEAAIRFTIDRSPPTRVTDPLVAGAAP